MQNEGILSSRKAAALRQVDRNLFVKSGAGPLVNGHSIPAEKFALQVLHHLEFPPHCKLLVIGAGSGYLPAVLSRLAETVVSIEKLPFLTSTASERYSTLGFQNIRVIEGDGVSGAVGEAPFHAIVVCTPSITDKLPLLSQLLPQGKLLAIEEVESRQEMLVQYTLSAQHRMERQELGLVSMSQRKEDILIEMGFASEDVLAEAKNRARLKGSSMIDELHQLVHIDDNELYRSLAARYNLKIGNVDQLLRQSQVKLFEAFPRAFLDHNHIIPLYSRDKLLVVATTDPDVSAREILSMYPNLTGLEKILVTPTDFRRLWSALTLCLEGKESTTTGPAAAIKAPDKDLLDKSLTHFEAHLVSLFEALLLDAVAENASDIHLEQYPGHIRIRLRIDGELRDIEHYTLSASEARGLVNVVKLRSDLNIAERRLPQGGRSRLRVGEAIFDLRVQTQPSLHGEHVVIRLLPQSSALIGIEQLGFSPAIAGHYQRLLDNPAGLVLVVGPTGSGKSTTLYAGLQLLAKDGRRKVITVEDPIEYSINNIQQTQVRPDIGFQFSDAMRSFVRQDPDVVLVGEIRDHDTALEAIRASQTGHVVLSTLHCNDAVDAMQRIFDLGIHPNSIASELLAVIAQRLAKRVCPKCKREAKPDPKILAELFPDGAPKSFRCYEGAGCDHCSKRGTRGRVGVVEYLQANVDIRDAISRHPPVGELRRLALDAGLVTMRDSALDHVIQGNIPLTELPRLLPAERMAPEPRWQWGRS